MRSLVREREQIELKKRERTDTFLLKEMDLIQKILDKNDDWILRTRSGLILALSALFYANLNKPIFADVGLFMIAFSLFAASFALEGVIREEHWLGFVQRKEEIQDYLNGEAEKIELYVVKRKAGLGRLFSPIWRKNVRRCWVKSDTWQFYLLCSGIFAAICVFSRVPPPEKPHVQPSWDRAFYE